MVAAVEGRWLRLETRDVGQTTRNCSVVVDGQHTSSARDTLLAGRRVSSGMNARFAMRSVEHLILH